MSAKVFGLAAIAFGWHLAAETTSPDVAAIIRKSVEVSNVDFEKAPTFNYKQRETTGGVTKTSQITMIDGSPYQRLLAINGKPLSAQAEANEIEKQKQCAEQRAHETPDQRRDRIAKYQKGRNRDHVMMSQLSVAFNFSLIGQQKMRGFHVWALKAVPRPGYQPPNMDSQVLPGMQGELWIDQHTYQWVKVIARVIHPVSIEGFLAQVEPGTLFEIEKSPVEDGIWQITHFHDVAHAKILGFFNHNDSDEITFFDFQPAKE